MRKRIGAAIVGFLCLAVTAIHAADGDQDLSMELFKASSDEAQAQKEKIRSAGYVVDNDPQAGKPSKPVEFVLIDGGKFTMGTDNGAKDATPIHEVTIEPFYISATLVTVEQYLECVIEGKCEVPGTGGFCNWGKKDRRRHPINCVKWDDANDFAAFKGARLPSEAEYEYAATSKGKNQPYPWGKDTATCEKAVMYGKGDHGCSSLGTMPVCSKPKGNTEQGLCDMVGNVNQWVGDTWHDSYAGAPADGSSWQDGGYYRVQRGGSFMIGVAGMLRADHRSYDEPGVLRNVDLGDRYEDTGFRLARSRR